MSILCSSTACAAPVVPPQGYDTCEQTTRKYGFRHFVLIDCDYQFTDITDPTEWQTAMTNNRIACSPAGRLTLNPPTETIYEWNDCKEKITIDGEYVIDFTTPFVQDDLSDFTYWKQVKSAPGSNFLLFIDCEGNFYMDQAYVEAINAGPAPVTVAGVSPGFQFSVSQTPHQANQQGVVEWTTQFTIEESGVLCAVQLPGVESMICS